MKKEEKELLLLELYNFAWCYNAATKGEIKHNASFHAGQVDSLVNYIITKYEGRKNSLDFREMNDAMNKVRSRAREDVEAQCMPMEHSKLSFLIRSMDLEDDDGE